MSRKFKRVAVIGKYLDPHAITPDADVHAPIVDIVSFLQEHKCEVWLDTNTHANIDIAHCKVASIEEIGQRCDLCIVSGGDGTMLGIGRQLARFGTPLIGINQGRLGFITDIRLDAYREVLPDMLAGAYEEERRTLMRARVMRDKRYIFEALAMNDVVVNRGAASGMVELRVEVDDHFVANHRADGIILATPTGSTAYSLSAGGPLLHPSIPAWTMVPISPHTLSNRPIVLADSVQVAIEIVSGRDASASFDMQLLPSLNHGDRIIVQRCPYSVRFLHPEGWSYFDTLREKLHWNKDNV